MLAERIRAMGAPHWLGLYGLILAGWAVLYAMALPADLRAMSELYGAEFWAALCRAGPEGAGFAGLFAMWSIMAAAMMAPTALPALATYEDLGRATPVRFGALVGGYLAVWLGFAALAAGAQMALYRAGIVDALGASRQGWFTALLLAGAGLYQFSALKHACLSRCRAPLTFFMQHWTEGPWRLGLRLGATCLGCCWALMVLGFGGGVMNLAFMGLATVLMALEKLPGPGRLLTAPLGWALLFAAALVASGAI